MSRGRLGRRGRSGRPGSSEVLRLLGEARVAGGAVAALVALAVGLHGRAPVGHRGRGHDAITIAAEPASTFGSRQSSCSEAWEPEGTDTE